MELNSTLLSTISTNCGGPCSVRVNQFFLSWNGVMTLAYDTFGKTLLEMKQHLNDNIKAELKPENPGTKWPKTTLGCLRDDVSELTLDQVTRIRDLCDQANAKLDALNEMDRVVTIDSLELVVFACRSLERRHLTTSTPLQGPSRTYHPEEEEEFIAVKENKCFVKNIMSEFHRDNLNACTEFLKARGRTLDAHCRANHVETTLVAPIHFSNQVSQIIKEFEDSVDEALDGMYGWFDKDSLHLSMRSLVPKEE